MSYRDNIELVKTQVECPSHLKIATNDAYQARINKMLAGFCFEVEVSGKDQFRVES